MREDDKQMGAGTELLTMKGFACFEALFKALQALPNLESPDSSLHSTTLMTNFLFGADSLLKKGKVTLSVAQEVLFDIKYVALVGGSDEQVLIDETAPLWFDHHRMSLRQTLLREDQPSKTSFLPLPAIFNQHSRLFYGVFLEALKDIHKNWNQYFTVPALLVLKLAKAKDCMPALITLMERQIGLYDQSLNEARIPKSTVPYLDITRKIMCQKTAFFQVAFDPSTYGESMSNFWKDILKLPNTELSIKTNCKSANEYNLIIGTGLVRKSRQTLIYRLLMDEYDLNDFLARKQLTCSASKVNDLVKGHCKQAEALVFEAAVLKELTALIKALGDYIHPTIRKSPDERKIKIASDLLETIKVCKASYEVKITAYDRAAEAASLIDLIAKVYHALLRAEEEHVFCLLKAMGSKPMTPSRLSENLLDKFIPIFKVYLEKYDTSLEPLFAKLCKLNEAVIAAAQNSKASAPTLGGTQG